MPAEGTYELPTDISQDQWAANGGLFIPPELQIQLDDGVYMMRLHRGTLAPDFSYDALSIGQMLNISNGIVIKILSVVVSDDCNDAYVKFAVLNGFAYLPLIVIFLVTTAVILAFHWGVTDLTKLSSSLTQTETTTETYTDAQGNTQTRVTTSTKPPNLNPFTSIASMLPIVIVAALVYALFFTPFGKRLMS